MPKSLTIRHVGLTYFGRRLLRDIDLELAPGEVVALAGRSGEGKSVLLELCAGMLAPDSGEVLWDGESLVGFSRSRLYDSRRRVGYMFQKHALISNMAIADNIALPLRYHSNLSERQIAVRVKQQMEECGLFNVDRKFPEMLSVGELRSAALARALIMDPEMLLLDDPTGGVDQITENGIANVLADRVQQHRPTVLMATSSVMTMKALGARVLVLDRGRLSSLRDLQQQTEEYIPPIATILGKSL